MKRVRFDKPISELCEYCKKRYIRPCHGKDSQCQNKLYRDALHGAKKKV